MAKSFGGQAPTAAQRRKSQRETAQAVKRGQSPLGGKYGKIVRQATARLKKQQAYKNFHGRLGNFISYNDETVREGIWHVMTPAHIEWTITADTEQIRDRASAQADMVGFVDYVILYKDDARNMFWYH